MTNRTKTSYALPRAIRSVLLLVAGAALGVSAHAEEGCLSGSINLEYVPQSLNMTDVGDQDIYLNLALNFGRSIDKTSGGLFWRAAFDVDGAPTALNDRFRSAYDTDGKDFWNQLYYAYLDQRVGSKVKLRIGRQHIYYDQPFHFDGLKMTLKLPANIRLVMLGGLPVYYFTTADNTDILSGAGLELPLGKSMFKATVVNVGDAANYAAIDGQTDQDSMLVLSYQTWLGPTSSLIMRQTQVGGEARDQKVIISAMSEKWGLRGVLSYYEQVATLSEFSPETSAIFTPLAIKRYPFSRMSASLSKRLKLKNNKSVDIEGRFITRALNSTVPVGEEPYNREYSQTWLGATLNMGEAIKAHAGVSTWSSDDDSLSSADVGLIWKMGKEKKLRIGSAFHRYKIDALTAAELENVRDTYLTMEWKHELVSKRLKYSLSNYGEDSVHKISASWTRRF